jgi:hypothetical protein
VEELIAAQEAVKEIYLDDLVKEYIVDIVRQTREHPDVYLGSSSRGALAIYRLSQARAALLGRDYVLPDDVKALATAALSHRIIVGPAARIKDIEPDAIVQDILDKLPVPVAKASGVMLKRIWRRLQKRRTAVIFLAIIALFSGLMTGRRILFNIAYLFAILLILSFVWAWVNINFVHLSRLTRTRRTQVGRPLEERFTVRNTSFLPKLWLEIRDYSDLPTHFSSYVVHNLGGKKSHSWRVNTSLPAARPVPARPDPAQHLGPFRSFPHAAQFDSDNQRGHLPDHL